MISYLPRVKRRNAAPVLQWDAGIIFVVIMSAVVVESRAVEILVDFPYVITGDGVTW